MTVSLTSSIGSENKLSLRTADIKSEQPTTSFADVAAAVGIQPSYTEAQAKTFFAGHPSKDQIADVAANLGLDETGILKAMQTAGYGGEDMTALRNTVEEYVATAANGFVWGQDGSLMRSTKQLQGSAAPAAVMQDDKANPYTGLAGAYQAWLNRQPNKDAGKDDVSFATWRNMQSRDDLIRLSGVTLTTNQKTMLAQSDTWTAQGMSLQEQMDRAAAAGKSQIDIDTVMTVVRYHSVPEQYPGGISSIKDASGKNLTHEQVNTLLAIPLNIDPLDSRSYGQTVKGMGLSQEQQAHLQAIRFGVQYFPTVGNVAGINVDYAGNPITTPMGGSAGAYNRGGRMNA